MGSEEYRRPGFWLSPIAEFLGVMFLVVIGCGSTEAFEESKIVRISLSFGLSIATLVWVTAHVSGGHLNPAVSFGFLVSRKMGILQFFLYVIAQLVGAICGAAILKGIVPKSLSTDTLGTSYPGQDVTSGQAFGVELLITFVLVWTVMASVDANRKFSGSGALAIGFAIAMCHLWAVPLTGAGMNPARVFGPAVISGTWKFHWAYWVGPLVGGAIAGFLYEFVFAVNATPAKLRGFFSADYDETNYDKYGEKSELGEDTELNKKDYGSTAP